MRSYLRHVVPLLLISTAVACTALRQIAALRQVDFALAGVQNGRLAGVPLARVASYRDLSVTEIGRLALAVAREEVPLDFEVNVRAENPVGNPATATMVRLAWTLLLDDREAIHGVLDSSHVLPAGLPVIIPLRVSLDLWSFAEGSAESLVNLAAGLAGLNADPTRIVIRAVPTIDTPLGPIVYPSPITIVSTTLGTGTPPRATPPGPRAPAPKR
jgi:hypothetical protein